MNNIKKKILAAIFVCGVAYTTTDAYNPANIDLTKPLYGIAHNMRRGMQQAITKDLVTFSVNNKAKAIAMFSAFSLIATYLYDAAFTTKNDLVETKFPYAYQWIQSIIAKYPQAHFENAWFIALNKPEIPLYQFKSVEEQERNIEEWKSTFTKPQAPTVQHGNVKYAYYMLEKINTIFENVANNNEISEEEAAFLQKQEWLLLQTAKSISSHSFSKKMLALFLGAVTVDNLFDDQNYRHIAGISLLVPFLTFLRYDNLQNEAFGNELADTAALEGGMTYLKEDVTNFVTTFAHMYNKLEENALSETYKTDALVPQSKAAQAIYAAIYNIKKYGSKAFFTCMKPVKFVCSQKIAQKGLGILFNPLHKTKEERITQIQKRIDKTA